MSQKTLNSYGINNKGHYTGIVHLNVGLMGARLNDGIEVLTAWDEFDNVVSFSVLRYTGMSRDYPMLSIYLTNGTIEVLSYSGIAIVLSEYFKMTEGFDPQETPYRYTLVDGVTTKRESVSK